MWDELTILWNDVTILWNDVTIDWNDLTWNDLTMERNDRKPMRSLKFYERSLLWNICKLRDFTISHYLLKGFFPHQEDIEVCKSVNIGARRRLCKS